MPNWNQVLEELKGYKFTLAQDAIRRKYLKRLFEYTGRNIIAYYSGWLQKPDVGNSDINDDDKNGFMATIHGLDRNKGLDLILHTPGGDTAATESLVDYLKRMFGNTIRAIIPQIAMSAGTMIACACKAIIMGKQSSIGPIDPHFGGIPAHGVIAEFQRAIEKTQNNPLTIPIWQAVVSKYHPTFIGECENAIKLSEEMVTKWLSECMFQEEKNPVLQAKKVVNELNNHEKTKTHARHINIDQAKGLGLKIIDLENDDFFQDLVLTIHHAYMHTFATTNAIKIVENHDENAIIYFSEGS